MSHFAGPASEFMKSPVHTVAADARLHVAYDKMRTLGISGLAVTNDDDKLVGVITRTDLLEVGRREAGSRPDAMLLTMPDRSIESVMTSDVRTAAPDAPLAQVAQKMRDGHFHRIFLVEDERLVGVVSTRDVMRAIRKQRVNVPISNYMSSPAFTVRASEPLSLATDRLAKAHISGLVVVEDEWPVGTFTQEEALAARELGTATRVEEAMSTAILSLPASTPLHRAAEQAATLQVRRVVVLDGAKVVGIVTGLDFVKATT